MELSRRNSEPDEIVADRKTKTYYQALPPGAQSRKQTGTFKRRRSRKKRVTSFLAHVPEV